MSIETAKAPKTADRYLKKGVSIERDLYERSLRRAAKMRRSFSAHVQFLLDQDLATEQPRQEVTP